eukprot:scaffold15945_cov106-Isochrysis_galbana.AAC.5
MGADLALICALILLAEACHSLRRARFGYDDDSDYSPSRSNCSMSSMDAAFSRPYIFLDLTEWAGPTARPCHRTRPPLCIDQNIYSWGGPMQD